MTDILYFIRYDISTDLYHWLDFRQFDGEQFMSSQQVSEVIGVPKITVDRTIKKFKARLHARLLRNGCVNG